MRNHTTANWWPGLAEVFDRLRAWLRPRPAVVFAAALFWLALVGNGFDGSLADRAAELNPANSYRTLNRQAHLAYARGVRFVNDLRLVYELRATLEELEAESSAAPVPSAASSEGAKKASPSYDCPLGSSSGAGSWR